MMDGDYDIIDNKLWMYKNAILMAIQYVLLEVDNDYNYI